MNPDRLLRLALLAVAAVALVVLARQLPLDRLREWVGDLGAWGPIALAAVYLVAPALLVPGAPLSLAAGALFGVGTGFLVVLPAATAGATLACVLGRGAARPWVERRIAGNPRVAALDEAVARHGFRIVLLTRLSPAFPFNLLNYLFGLTRVRLGDFVLASLLGMAPGALLYVYLGAAGAEAAGAGRERTPLEWALFGVGLLATLVVAVLVTRLARRALQTAAPGVNGGGS